MHKATSQTSDTQPKHNQAVHKTPQDGQQHSKCMLNYGSAYLR
jgi:hypothetical protein